ncbi:MAG: glycine cleavage system aminomethyltransferase GcvT [Candidatus Hodarchaeota archaeon]
MDLKKSPLHEIHEKNNAKFTEFGGWYLPVQYTSIVEEHVNTREKVSLFDISHMGELIVKGKNAFHLLQYVCTNDVSPLRPGFSQYSPMCYESGTVVDDMFYYCYSRRIYRLIVNASNKDKDVAWLQEHAKKFEDIQINDLSASRGRLALQGPKSQDVLGKLVENDLEDMIRFEFMESEMAGVPVFIARTGYTGEDGFEISFGSEEAENVWTAIMNAGKEFGILPAGLGARNTLRLDACYSLYGHEFSETVTPVEAGVEFVIKPSKIDDYIGKDVLLKQLFGIVDMKIVALWVLDKGIPRHGYEIYDDSEEERIGTITSGTFSPTFKNAIALAHIDSTCKIIGTIVKIKVRNKFIRANIVNRPFYEYHPRRST